MKNYDFTPDYNNLVLAAKNRPAPRMPLYEHIVGSRMMQDIICLLYTSDAADE